MPVSKKSVTSTTQRTIAECTRRGYVNITKTEYYVPSFHDSTIARAARKVFKDGGNIAELRDLVLHGKQGFGRRHDLYGFIDVLCQDPNDGFRFIAIQSTSDETSGNAGARKIKILGECHEAAKRLLRGRARILIWGWKQYKEKVDGRNWRANEIEVTLEDFRKPL
jgi:hypothetical protein